MVKPHSQEKRRRGRPRKGASTSKNKNMDSNRISGLKQLIQDCRSDPSIIHDPSLSFFKDYLHSLGARIPQGYKSERHCAKKTDSSTNDDDEFVEPPIELDDADVVEPDNDPPQKMGDPTVEVTEEGQEVARLEKVKAIDALAEGRLEDAVNHLTEAIMFNPASAILYATRANVFAQMKKPNAAICDADAALQINPNSAKGYKVRGMAKAMLGLWEQAASDLHEASKLDYDEEIALVLKKVEPNVNKIKEHRSKCDRLKKERKLKRAALEKQKHKEAQDEEALGVLKAGEVIDIHSKSELDTKMSAAQKMSRLVIIYFTATWCGPCRTIAPVYTSLASLNPKVVFLKVDIEEASDVAASRNISSIPTFFFMKNGKEVDQVVGADKSVLEKKIVQHAG